MPHKYEGTHKSEEENSNLNVKIEEENKRVEKDEKKEETEEEKLISFLDDTISKERKGSEKGQPEKR